MSALIRMYPTLTSCIAGQPIFLCAASTAAVDGAYTLRVVRAADEIAVTAPVPVTIPVIPDHTPSNIWDAAPSSHADEGGYDWPSVALATGASWRSGLYFAEILHNAVPIPTSRAYFVVRTPPRARRNRIVIHFPFANAHAYGAPKETGWGNRKCVYDSNHQLRARRVTTQKPAFDQGGKPAIDGLGYGIAGGVCPALELYRWLPADLAADACSSWDLHADPGVLTGYTLLVLAGHDEYWSREMRDNVEAFVARGGHMAVFAGNTAWWQIRYSSDGTQVTCYKNVLEDPLLGVDDSRVTGNWVAAPTARPENRLTGVGTRYGWLGGHGPLQIVAPDHPAFAGLAGSGGVMPAYFGHGLQGEADGIELDLADPARPQPTGRDGTPDTFQVLACNESAVVGSYVGRAVMGFYTNAGTVATCPVTNWVDQIAKDRQVARVTENVIRWLLRRTPATRMRSSLEVPAPAEWTAVETGPFTALTALFQGRVVAAEGTGLRSRHPGMTGGWESVPQAALTDAPFDTLGTTLYGTTLYAGLGNRLLSAPVGDHAVGSWAALTTFAAGERVLGVTQDVPFVIVDSGTRAELRTKHGGWFVVGDATGIAAVTDCDGYLVGATTAGRLVARVGGPLRDNGPMVCDQTWFDLGPAPEATFALGHYFGRLYALGRTSGGARLSWRVLRPDAASLPVDHGRLLFYNRDTGAVAVGRFLGNGDYENVANLNVGAGWTHVLRVNGGMVMFYSASAGTAMLGRVQTDGSWAPVGGVQAGFSPWSAVVSDGAHVLFYRTGASVAYAGYFDTATGVYRNTYFGDGFSPDWSAIAVTRGPAAPVGGDPGRYVVFYAPDGRLAFGLIDEAGQYRTVGYGTAVKGATAVVPAGQLGLFLYNAATGEGEFGELSVGSSPEYTQRNRWGNFPPGWTIGSGRNGLLFFYKATAQGTMGAAGGFSRDGIYQELNNWGTDAGLSAGWTHIAGI